MLCTCTRPSWRQMHQASSRVYVSFARLVVVQELGTGLEQILPGIGFSRIYTHQEVQPKGQGSVPGRIVHSFVPHACPSFYRKQPGLMMSTRPLLPQLTAEIG
jgi:hypothetical protein